MTIFDNKTCIINGIIEWSTCQRTGDPYSTLKFVMFCKILKVGTGIYGRKDITLENSDQYCFDIYWPKDLGFKLKNGSIYLFLIDPKH